MNRSSVRLAGALGLSLALASATASAQPARPATAATPVEATRHAAAQQRFERGLGLFDQNDFATALTEFRASLELFSSPNVRLYVGLCLLRTGHLAEAHAELQRTFNEARDLALTDPNYVDARDAAQQELTRLQPRLGRVVVRLPRPSRAWPSPRTRPRFSPRCWAFRCRSTRGRRRVAARARRGTSSFVRRCSCSPTRPRR